MTQIIKLKVINRAIVKTKALIRYPSQIVEGTGIDVALANGIVTVRLNYADLVELAAFDSAEKRVAIYDPVTGAFNVITLATLINAGQTQQIITTGNATVVDTDGLIIINKTVGAATTVTLPAASIKIGPVKIVDFKGDAGTNNITINAVGSDKFNGNLSSWIIGSDTGSVVLHPTTDGWAV